MALALGLGSGSALVSSSPLGYVLLTDYGYVSDIYKGVASAIE